MPKLLFAIWQHLSRRRRLQLGLVLMIMFASGFAELLSLSSVLPFLALLSDPDWILQQAFVQQLTIQIGITDTSHLLLLATLVFACASISAGTIRLINLWSNGRLSAAIGSDLSCEAYRRTLYQPYEKHVQRNSASVITSSTTQISITVAAFNSLLQLITCSVVAVGLITGLLVINAPVAIGSALLFGLAYLFLVFRARSYLRRNSYKIAEATTQQLKALQEGLGAIRDVLLDCSQREYFHLYRQADIPLRRLEAINSFIGAYPRYAIEALGMVAIALFGGLFVWYRGSDASVVPLLGTLALGAQRLLPALQQIYSGWASLKSASAAMQGVLEMLNQPLPLYVSNISGKPFKKSLRFDNVCFSYGLDQKNILSGLNLEIQRGQRVGFIGKTGSGKSTIIDLMMGLLTPTSGRILVDGINLNDSNHPEVISAWHGSIAHVPQSIYLGDSTIAENIAFGLPPSEIDYERVKLASKQAQIHSFIESMPCGYNSLVGERGVRLSGGQRQRIGIARALYKQAQIIFLDEATSALDNETEKSIIEAVDKLGNNITIILIAHRLSTIQLCDRVIKLQSGMIINDGSPNEVIGI